MARRILYLGIVLLVLRAIMFPLPAVVASGHLQVSEARQKARDLLARMSPEERVGQLFLVTFRGRPTNTDAQIYDLIRRHHIGGVILTAENDNFGGPADVLPGVLQLTTTLQQVAWEKAQTGPGGNPTIGESNYIPLLIGISQEGDGFPNDQILNGVTVLPNQMAIGATWKPELAERVGTVLGKELKALGFNLFLGPSLDVLDAPLSETGENLGTRTFGGDPYWVGEMGKAYIAGIHKGSENQVATVSKYFPGRGGSDRSPEKEVATVRKSLEQLKQIELSPFFAVTGNAPSPEATTDGLLISHTRYQGFQGNIRATTRPVSFDPAAFDLLMKLPAFAAWRENGGVVVSDSLGNQAVRRLFDPTGVNFDARQVARNAFLAGNDLLLLDNFVATNDPDSYTTINNTLALFLQKYREDVSFAQRVDLSVERILTLKFRLYPEFDLNRVVPDAQGLEEVGKSQQVTFDIARQAATLLSPDPAELNTSLPRAPEMRERIIFLSDALTGRQCSSCPAQPALAFDALRNAVLRLYGPSTGGQVLNYNLTAYSFTDLTNLLNNAPDLPPIENDLKIADWVVVSLYQVQTNRSESLAFNRLLSERPELLRNKKVIVFAFNAPYFLDATDISKLTAYYGMYSKSSAFIDLAARILFQESAAVGASPVSVPGLGYDLITMTSPDPDQVIPLMLDIPEELAPTESLISATTTVTISPQSTPVPLFKVGDTIPLKTGMIYDHNGNVVPDGTVVRFLFMSGAESEAIQQIETVTQRGIARTSFRIQSAGLLEIRAASDPAVVSEILRLDISAGQAAAVTEILPTQEPTLTSTPTPTTTITPTITPTVTSTPPPLPYQAGANDWLISMLVVWGGGGLVYWLMWQKFSMRWGVRMGLLVVMGGGIAYLLYLVLDPPNHREWFNQARIWGVLIMEAGGCALGWLAGWIWKRIQDRKPPVYRPRHPNGSK